MEQILTATLTDGTSIVISETFNREQLKAWRTERHFRCPQCGERVLLKVGSIRIPHFAHVADSNCSSSFSEGESIPHLQGKQVLHSLFQRLGLPVEVEAFLPELTQRPDLLVHYNGQAVPIEFQCSRILENLKEARTIGYQSIGMCPIWVLHTPEKVRTRAEGVEVFSFSAFQQLFFTTSLSPGATLLTLSPETKQFHYVSHLLHIEGNRFLGVHRKLPSHLQSFPFARPKLLDTTQIRQYVQFYKIQRTTYLQRSVFLNRRGIQDPFLRSCYELKFHPTTLPEWIGVPVQECEAFSVHDCEWQLGLIHWVRQSGLVLTRMSTQQLHRYVHRYVGSSKRQVVACRAYIQFLQQIEWKKKEFVTSERIEQEMIHMLIERFLAIQIEN